MESSPKRFKLAESKSRMSFRKRGEVISGGNGRVPSTVPNRNPIVPNAVPDRGIPPTHLSQGALPNRGTAPIPTRGPILPGRGAVPTGTEPLVSKLSNLSIEVEIKHPGIRPSSINSTPTVSTGSSDLDKILGHQGIPTGSSILIEESGTTDFSSVLLKNFASQGIIHNRLDPKVSNTHLIVIGQNVNWGKELPGLYKGSRRDVKKNQILENEQKVSVQNLINTQENSTRSSNKDLKIAWRYGLNDPNKNQKQDAQSSEIHKDFNNQFDITTRLSPSPNTNEITYIQVRTSFRPIIKELESVIKKQEGKVIRLVIPSILNLSIYSPQLSSLDEVLPFIHSLRSLLRKYSNRLVVIATLPLDLYPRESFLVRQFEILFDSIFHLEPFNQDMIKFLEKAYHNQPTKIQHGLVHIYKIPSLSEKGQMLVMKSEFAFKNGKKKFEIEEWGIPVEDEGEPQQTTTNIEF